MTGKADFTEEEWKTVLEGPPSAGTIVVTAQRGGTFKESFAIGKAYVEARKQHGLQRLRDAVGVLEQKATPDEVDGYRRFVLMLAERVAGAHREEGQAVSEAERAAIDEISASLGQASAGPA